MKKNGFKKILILLGIMAQALAVVHQARGQAIYPSSGLIQPMDNMGGSARAMAMGSAFVGVADDSSALLWNPAGLAGLRQGEVAFHHNSWLVDTLQEAGIFGMPLRDVGGIGVMGSYLGYGTLEGRDATGAITPGYSASKLGLMVGWGKEWIPGVSAGAALRGSQQTIANKSYSLFSGDIGLLLTSGSRFRVGAALVNLGGDQSGGLVASALRVGVSVKPDLGSSQALLLAFSGTVEPQGVNRLQAGAEYGFESKYFLRAGYQGLLSDDGIDGFKGFTAGAGVILGNFSLDYAYLPYGELGTSHRVSLGYQFEISGENSSVARTVTIPPSTAKEDKKEKPASPSGRATATSPSAVPAVNELAFVNPSQLPPDVLAKGRALEKEGKSKEAVGQYLEALHENNKDGLAWHALGDLYFRMGRGDYASQCYQQVLRLLPDQKPLADWLEQFKASHSPAPPEAPASPLPAFTPGTVTPEPESGPTDQKDGLLVQFDLPDDAKKEGRELEKQGKHLEAIQVYVRVIQKNNKDALAWYDLGNIYYKIHKKDYTIHCIQQVLRLQPENRALARWLEKYKAQSSGE